MLRRLWEYPTPGAPKKVAIDSRNGRVGIVAGGLLHHELLVLEKDGRLRFGRRIDGPHDLVRFAADSDFVLVPHKREGAGMSLLDGSGAVVSEPGTAGESHVLSRPVVSAAAVSGDGRTAVVAFNLGSTLSIAWTVDGKVVGRHEDRGSVEEVALSENATLLAVTCGDYHVAKGGGYFTNRRLLTFGPAGNPLGAIGLPSNASGLVTAPDGSLLAFASDPYGPSPWVRVHRPKGSQIWGRRVDPMVTPLGFLTDGSLWGHSGTGYGPFRSHDPPFVLFSPDGAPVRRVHQGLEDGIFGTSPSFSRLAVCGTNSLDYDQRLRVLDSSGSVLGEAPLPGVATAVAAADAPGLILVGTSHTVIAFEEGAEGA